MMYGLEQHIFYAPHVAHLFKAFPLRVAAGLVLAVGMTIGGYAVHSTPAPPPTQMIVRAPQFVGGSFGSYGFATPVQLRN